VGIQAIPSLESITPLNPEEFVFFKGLNAPAQDGILSAEVQGGLSAGTYRMCSINSSTNHQPVLVAVAQRGSLDDCVYVSHWRRGLPPLLLLEGTLTSSLDAVHCQGRWQQLHLTIMTIMTIKTVEKIVETGTVTGDNGRNNGRQSIETRGR
jgi:hypothetical protein